MGEDVISRRVRFNELVLVVLGVDLILDPRLMLAVVVADQRGVSLWEFVEHTAGVCGEADNLARDHAGVGATVVARHDIAVLFVLNLIIYILILLYVYLRLFWRLILVPWRTIRSISLHRSMACGLQ